MSTTPNAPTAAEFPAISPQAEIEALRSMNTRQVEIIGELEAELSNVSAAIGTVEFMDLPDGGDVSLSEQVRRMRAALLAARREVEAAQSALRAAAHALGEIAKGPLSGAQIIAEETLRQLGTCAKLDAALLDSRRLDFLQKQAWRDSDELLEHEIIDHPESHLYFCWDENVPLREAIDRARAALAATQEER